MSGSLTVQEALQRAHAHWEAGQAEQAEQLCQRVLAVWPAQPDALHLLGLMAHAYGNIDLGIQHLRHASLSPRVPALYLSNLAEMLRQKGELTEAEEMARRAVALEPGLLSAWNNLGIILQEVGKLNESARCLERVVSTSPSAATHNNLGNTYNRQGELQKARAQYVRALELRPAYAEAESNIAFLLNELGQPEEACAAARRAIDINPKLADAYVNLAAGELGRRRYAEALHWLEALLAFAPNHAGALAAQARVLNRLDRAEAGLAAAEHACAVAPQSAEAHAALGEVLQGLQRYDDAFAAFTAAAGLPGTARKTALLGCAALQLELGRTQEALATYDAMLAEKPRSAAVLSMRAELKTFERADPDISLMEQLLVSGEVQSLTDRTSLHFALGKAYLDVDLAPLAFDHLGRGNRLKRSTFRFDVAAAGHRLEEIAQASPAAMIERLSVHGNPSIMPIFIVGMPRSGTTLLEQILASHPQINGAGELSVLENLASSVQGYPAAAADLTPEVIAGMGRTYVERVASLSGGRPYLVDKMPANFMHVGLIRIILPNARIIHSRRNAVDTCLSCYTKLFQSEQMFAYDLAELGAFHRHYERLMAHWRQVVPATHFIEMDYEAVVKDQEGETRRLIAALNLEWDERCLAFHTTSRPVRTASAVQVRSPLYRTSVERWTRYSDHLGPLLASLGGSAA